MPRQRGSRRRGRGRAAFSRAVQRVERPRLQRLETGVIHDPGLRPGTHAISPWVMVVTELGNKGDQTFSPNKILNVLRPQHGYTVICKDKNDKDVVTNVAMDIRFVGFKLWGLGSQRPVALTVHDFRSQTRDPILKHIAWPAYNQFPRVGFWLPKFMTELTFDDTDTDSKIISIDTSADISWLCFAYCLVRPSGAETVGAMIQQYEDLVDLFERL